MVLMTAIFLFEHCELHWLEEIYDEVAQHRERARHVPYLAPAPAGRQATHQKVLSGSR